jgi:hypothetical protein
MININNLKKYLILFTVISISTFIIPTCGVLKKHAIYVGLIGASTFALIDICFPNVILTNNDNYNNNNNFMYLE